MLKYAEINILDITVEHLDNKEVKFSLAELCVVFCFELCILFCIAPPLKI